MKDHAQEMAEAHTDLSVFAAVVALLEGGLLSAGAQPDDFKIIALAKRAQVKCLRRFDRARAKLRATDA